MEIAILLGLIVLNGLFAMAEIALVSARKVRLQKLVDEGDRAAAAALALGSDPNRFLSTIQIGITSIGILNGIFGEAALAAPFAAWLETLGIGQPWAGYAATVLVVVVVTYVSIVVGELVPKRFGQIDPEGIARLVAYPMTLLATLSRPFVRLLSASTDLVLRGLGAHGDRVPSVTEEEIHALLAEGSYAGVIEQSEHAMVRNVFRLDDRQISSLMVPRADVVWLDVDDPLPVNLAKVVDSAHSRFPVCRDGFGEILGFVHSKQLLAQSLRGTPIDLTQGLQEIVYVPETLTGMELLENFRSSNTQIALVVDEYGEVQGLITLQDLMESITGEFASADGSDSWAWQREDGSWLLDGLIPVPELKDHLGLRTLPEEERERYQALSGMLMLMLGRMPQTGDTVTWENWRFEIVDMDGNRVDKVMATRIPVAAATDEAEPAEGA
ncbi:MAG: HlyC/CorC family transporter [Lautropia sp.]|nr:MAG: HlyC/CorC family transporter [Pseudomonadota bacterium]MBC6960059.1 HlyC/CorC family transporter [Lautropia sp.]MCL4702317.1 hemolysin family protein [Burkholderiaceae bacterium]MCZ2412840.1 hemolysin family protein [Burkholderiales bacterium]MDL1907576.1 HlyC/CorC family transporter [Betaproteobacteria bacterium PRO1]